MRAQAQLAEVAADVVGDLLQQRYGPVSASQDAAVLEELDALTRSLCQHCGQSKAVGSPHSDYHAARSRAITSRCGSRRTGRPRRGARETEAIIAKTVAALDAGQIDPGLLGRLETAVAESRQNRCALSLILWS